MLRKDLLLEWRQRYALNGMLLYVASAVFVVYLSLGVRRGLLGPNTWNTVFWIILLFTAVNAVAKGFMQESQQRLLYYYTIVSPQAVILAKIIYNGVLMLVLGLLGLAIYSLVLGNPVQDLPRYILTLVLGSLSFSSALTMVSAIAAKAGRNTALMAILSFPVILPTELMCIRLSKQALDGLDWSVSMQPILILAAINLLLAGLSFLLFPYLWRT